MQILLLDKIKEHKKCTQENGNLSTFFVYKYRYLKLFSSYINDLTSLIAQLGDVSLQTSVSEFMNIGTVAGQVSQLYLCDVLAREYEKLNKVDVDKIKEQALAAVMKKSI